MSIELVMPFNHLILCHPLLLLPSIFPTIRIFSNESALRIRWPKYWSFNFNISPSNEHPGLISLRWTGWISLQSKGLSRVFSNTTVQKHQLRCSAFFTVQLSHPYMTTGKIALTRWGAGIFRCPQIYYCFLTVFAMIPCCFYTPKESASVTKLLGQSFSHS